MIDSAKKTYWAGFVDGKIADMNGYCHGIPQYFRLFTRRKDAKLYFDDVRKVEIKEVG